MLRDMAERLQERGDEPSLRRAVERLRDAELRSAPRVSDALVRCIMIAPVFNVGQPPRVVTQRIERVEVLYVTFDNIAASPRAITALAAPAVGATWPPPGPRAQVAQAAAQAAQAAVAQTAQAVAAVAAQAKAQAAQAAAAQVVAVAPRGPALLGAAVAAAAAAVPIATVTPVPAPLLAPALAPLASPPSPGASAPHRTANVAPGQRLALIHQALVAPLVAARGPFALVAPRVSARALPPSSHAHGGPPAPVDSHLKDVNGHVISVEDINDSSGVVSRAQALVTPGLPVFVRDALVAGDHSSTLGLRVLRGVDSRGHDLRCKASLFLRVDGADQVHLRDVRTGAAASAGSSAAAVCVMLNLCRAVLVRDLNVTQSVALSHCAPGAGRMDNDQPTGGLYMRGCERVDVDGMQHPPSRDQCAVVVRQGHAIHFTRSDLHGAPVVCAASSDVRF